MSPSEPPTDTDAADLPASDALPVPIDTARSYLYVRPADEPLSPETITTHFRRLHRLGQEKNTRLHYRLFHASSIPLIECLLISDGGADGSIQYAFGIDDPTQLDTLERLLRGLFPNAYQIERKTCTDRFLHRLFPKRERSLAAVELYGHAERRGDWQTKLTPFSAFHEDEQTRLPLATVIETMATHECPMVYQALLKPKPDWSGRAETRRVAIEANHETLRGQLGNVIFGSPDEDAPLPRGDEVRIEELEARDTRRSFELNARIMASETNATEAITELAAAFTEVSQTSYDIEGRIQTGDDAHRIFEAIRDRTFIPAKYERLKTRLPWVTNTSRGIVADASEAPSFCVLGGEALPAAGARAVAPTPGERTALPRPPFEQLTNYRGQGMRLGRPLTQDGTPDEEPLTLPPTLQPLHVGWFGKTGSGKSTSLINAILGNHRATGGADILIDPKGDGMAIDYLQAHYATYGTLDNVLYFDCAEMLPAFSFFDIRDELKAGVPRTTAVEDTVDHYIEILTQIMGRDRFDQAVRSPDIIRYLVKAMFDPVSGYEAFSHRDLHSAVRQMHERQAAPAVSDPDLERMLAGVVANRARSFDEIMQGVANRMEKIPVDQRLARVFNHVPGADDAHFDLAEYLNDDVVIIFNTGELRTEAQRVLTLVILSNLWTALRRRARRGSESRPLVNVYLEEAASIAVSDLLKQLLAQSRGFGCSITLAMQFPAQLRGQTDDVYDEVLNNISTFVTGNVPVDTRLAERLATDEMSPQAVGNRLRALRRGQWLVSLPAGFDAPEPRPFLIGSLAPPPGDPAGSHPLTVAEKRTVRAEIDNVQMRTKIEAGLVLESPNTPPDDETEEEPDTQLRVDSALPHTNRMPPTVQYSGASHALRCTECSNRYDPDITGMKRAIACCSSLEDVDRDDVPICDLHLKLTPDERAVSEYSEYQLMFMQAVYNAQQLRYDPIEYDLLSDSMIRIQEYIGIGSDAIQDLIDADLLRHDTDHPHRLYTVTPQGRTVIGESYRQGVDYGHGAGDLEESSEHVLAVEVARQYLEYEYVADPESAVVEVVPYYDLDDQHRLDIAALDDAGEIRVAVEAERINNDVARAVPVDFDKMAACDVDEAIWVVMKQADGHAVLQALNDPLEGEPRVTKTYAKTTPPQQFRIETPGLTAVYPAEWLRDQMSAPEDD
ncbi:type IV secretory system conjugative DNA transfer family protein [Halobellus inordinatus]|uniref:type IV secretory system conjugative DNA transfer family protein n=1 Tax=Halobellus inordinatus TaxID=1126236 RepID=UPI0021156632|nr:ATP-binding protein [Halobellus ramosii]